MNVEGLLTDVSKGIGLVSAFDYTVIAWTRSAENADIVGFMRATLSTINLIRQLTRATELATIAQYAYNTALAIGQALTPWGIVALGLGAAYFGGQAISGATTPAPTPYNLGAILEAQALEQRGGNLDEFLTERGRRLRERYRSSVP